jgi:tyrosinase
MQTTASPKVMRPSPDPVVPLELPHNEIHLVIGGHEIPNRGDVDTVPSTNGNTGESDTAGFDPVFFFHHCFVDHIFRRWQVAHCETFELDIIMGYPGTNSVDFQGPTPGVTGGDLAGYG